MMGMVWSSSSSGDGSCGGVALFTAIASIPVRAVWVGDRAGGRATLFAGSGAFDLLFQEIVQQRSQGGDRGKLANLRPTGGDGRAQDVGPQLKFQRHRQPASQPQAYVFLRLWRVAPHYEHFDSVDRRLNDSDRDNQRGDAFDIVGELHGP